MSDARGQGTDRGGVHASAVVKAPVPRLDVRDAEPAPTHPPRSGPGTANTGAPARWAPARTGTAQAVPVLAGARQVVDGPAPAPTAVLSDNPTTAGTIALLPTQACVGRLRNPQINL